MFKNKKDLIELYNFGDLFKGYLIIGFIFGIKRESKIKVEI